MKDHSSILIDQDASYLLACYTIEGSSLILDVRIEISPEFNEEEGRLWSLVVKFLQAALFLREFIVYLPDIDSL